MLEPALPLCLLCNEPLYQVHKNISSQETNQLFDILNCHRCHLQQTWPQPADLSPFYPTRYYQNRHSFLDRFCAKRRLRWVHQFHGRNKGKLLDIGCGKGTFLLSAKEAGWWTAGIELNTNIPDQRLFISNDIEEMHAFAPFDCITLWHTLEHMTDPGHVLGTVYRLLSPQGTLFIAVPNVQGWQARLYGKDWLHLDVPRHLFHFSPPSLSTLLHRHHFQVSKTFHQEFEYDLMGWAQSTLNRLQLSPNLFFKLLTQQNIQQGLLSSLLNLMGGISFSILFLPLLLFSNLAHAGGTLIVAARKSEI